MANVIVAANAATLELNLYTLDTETGTGFDLTGANIGFSIVDLQTESSTLTATIGDGIVINNISDGRYTVTFTATQMQSLSAKEYEGRRKLTDATGFVSESFFVIVVREGRT